MQVRALHSGCLSGGSSTEVRFRCFSSDTVEEVVCRLHQRLGGARDKSSARLLLLPAASPWPETPESIKSACNLEPYRNESRLCREGFAEDRKVLLLYQEKVLFSMKLELVPPPQADVDAGAVPVELDSATATFTIPSIEDRFSLNQNSRSRAPAGYPPAHVMHALRESIRGCKSVEKTSYLGRTWSRSEEGGRFPHRDDSLLPVLLATGDLFAEPPDGLVRVEGTAKIVMDYKKDSAGIRRVDVEPEQAHIIKPGVSGKLTVAELKRPQLWGLRSAADVIVFEPHRWRPTIVEAVDDSKDVVGT